MNIIEQITVHIHDNSKTPVDQKCLGEFNLRRNKTVTLHMHDGPCVPCPQGHCHHGSIAIVLSPKGEVFVVFENLSRPAHITFDDYQVVGHREPESSLTGAQRRLVELDLRKREIEAYYEELELVIADVAKEIGIDGYFRADDGTVYKIVNPEGRFVKFKDLDFIRTKREGEARGTLSMKEAEEAMLLKANN